MRNNQTKQQALADHLFNRNANLYFVYFSILASICNMVVLPLVALYFYNDTKNYNNVVNYGFASSLFFVGGLYGSHHFTNRSKKSYQKLIDVGVLDSQGRPHQT